MSRAPALSARHRKTAGIAHLATQAAVSRRACSSLMHYVREKSHHIRRFPPLEAPPSEETNGAIIILRQRREFAALANTNTSNNSNTRDLRGREERGGRNPGVGNLTASRSLACFKLEEMVRRSIRPPIPSFSVWLLLAPTRAPCVRANIPLSLSPMSTLARLMAR